MEVRYELETGWPVNSTLQQRISAYIRSDRAKKFKVGITNNPERRASSYDTQCAIQRATKYDEMIVVYQTQSKRNLDQMERFLIEYYDGNSDNINNGGGGPKGVPPYFLYVVRRRLCR